MSEAVQAAIEARERRNRGEPEPKTKKAKPKTVEELSPFDYEDERGGDSPDSEG